VSYIFKFGTDDEKAAAREYWQLSTTFSTATGINARIRLSLAEELGAQP
jgi:hypothetical protein